MRIDPVKSVAGSITIPGDKSISHRAVMLGALAEGKTEISGFLPGEDCHATIDCMKALGAIIDTPEPGRVIVHGTGPRGLCPPENKLYAGNSGTTVRLLSGILAGHPFESVIDGDASIRSRPMRRIIDPLTRMGAQIGSEDGGRCPLVIRGGGLRGITYKMPVASAQVKSCILLAGLYAEGQTTVIEEIRSRDHTERMLGAFGADIRREEEEISVLPAGRLFSQSITVPGDISPAAFFLAAALILQDSELLLKNVGINETRTGILDVAAAMGGRVEMQNLRSEGAEAVADLVVKSSSLHGTEIGGDIIPRLIDELPVIAVLAAFAEGETVIRNAEELRNKESDRISSVVKELSKAGVSVRENDDGMIIRGGVRPKGARFESASDHRLAMALSVLALAADGSSDIDGASVIAVSYPGFYDSLRAVAKG